MNTILKKQYILLILTTIIVFVFIGFLGIVFSKIKLNTVRVQETKERLMSYQVNKKAFNDETNQIRSLQERLTNLESKIVTNQSVPELLSKLESLATENKLEFEITSVQTIIENEAPKLIIECNTHGSYQQIVSFFNLLQHQEFQIKIRKFFVFSEQGPSSLSEVAGTLSTGKTKTAPLPKEVLWQGVATIEIISFK